MALLVLWAHDVHPAIVVQAEIFQSSFFRQGFKIKDMAEDNAIMILLGEVIDATLCVQFLARPAARNCP